MSFHSLCSYPLVILGVIRRANKENLGDLTTELRSLKGALVSILVSRNQQEINSTSIPTRRCAPLICSTCSDICQQIPYAAMMDSSREFTAGVAIVLYPVKRYFGLKSSARLHCHSLCIRSLRLAQMELRASELPLKFSSSLTFAQNH